MNLYSTNSTYNAGIITLLYLHNLSYFTYDTGYLDRKYSYSSNLRSLKNAFIMQSKSTFLEFLDGYSSLQIWLPRKILQGQILQAQMTSLQSTMCLFSFTWRPACLSSLTFCEVLTTRPVEKTSP